MGDLTKNIKSVKWQSPSNIAIVKYWGKKENQIPINPSISFSLSNSLTKTEIIYSPRKSSTNISVDFNFEGFKNKAFENKILKYLTQIKPQFQIFDKYHLSIKTKNTFPHSAGIASSASSMSALVLCLLSIEHYGQKIPKNEFYQKASYYSRLASGSASRSLYPGFSLWGKTTAIKTSSDDFSVQLTDVHPIFNKLQDAILIINSKPKKVSSSEGHQLMENHPYKEKRIAQGNEHTIELIKALKTGNFQVFARICEIEALSLHSLMMTSSPSYVLMETNSLKVIEKVKDFRKHSGLNLCFSLDAGPNIHLIYPKSDQAAIIKFIEEELLVYCESDKWIADEIGCGPKELNNASYEQ